MYGSFSKSFWKCCSRILCPSSYLLRSCPEVVRVSVFFYFAVECAHREVENNWWICSKAVERNSLVGPCWCTQQFELELACTLKFCNWLLKTRCRRKLLNRKFILSSKLWRSWKQVFWRHFGAVFWREQTWLVSFSNLRQLVWDLQWVFFSHWICRDATREKQVRRVCWDGE